MKLKFIPVFIFALLAVKTGFAQDSAAVKKPAIVANKLKPYNQVITAKAVTKTGLFKVHQIDDKVFFEIPDEVLSREFLFTTRLSKVAVGSPRFGGDLMNGMIVSFEKAPSDKLYVRAITSVSQSDSSNAISVAVRNASIDPIVMVLDLKARGTDNKSSVIDMTDFFMKDNMISGFHASTKKQMGTGSPVADKSMLLSANAYPNNIEIKSMKTYSMAGGAAKGGDAAAGDVGGSSASTGVTFEISNSVMVLPKEQMQAQAFDPRVGYSSDSYNVFSDAQQKVEEKRFIIRNRLEVKPEDLEKYKKGILVEPVEPLVYYVDPSTPKQYRQYIIAGINDWNKAFEAAGFKNAIVGKEWPENDKSMDIDDVRYRVIRYMPSTSPFVDNNKIADPRSGEILQSTISWSHSQVKALHDLYMVQAGATDPGARSMKFSEVLMGALIRAEVSRTVGFTLGLRENLAGSSTVPLEKLRDKVWLETHPYNSSIMDYSHYNYVAQPTDGVSRKGLIPQIGDYDKWAIKWAYTYTGVKDFEADKKIRLKMIADHVKPGSNLVFGTQPQGVIPTDITNPSAQWEDLSNNPVKAAELGMNNLKVVMANLLKWTTTDDNTYYNTSDLYYSIITQYAFLARHAFTQIGGINETIKSVEQAGDVYTPVSKATQKAAIAFLNKEIFNTPKWLYDPNVLNKFRKPAKKEEAQRYTEDILGNLYKADRLFRLNTATLRYGKEKTYTVDEMLTDLNKGLFAELATRQPVDGTKRYLQKFAVENMLQRLDEGSRMPDPAKESIAGTDIPVILRSQLRGIMAQCKAAVVGYTDPLMVAHLKYMADKIDNALNPKN